MVAKKKTRPITFERAMRRVPLCLTGGMDQEKTLFDLWFLAQHELDLYEEGEDNNILTKRTAGVVKRYMAWIEANAPEGWR